MTGWLTTITTPIKDLKDNKDLNDTKMDYSSEKNLKKGQASATDELSKSLSMIGIPLKPPNNSRIDGKCTFGQHFAAAISLCKTLSIRIGGWPAAKFCPNSIHLLLYRYLVVDVFNSIDIFKLVIYFLNIIKFLDNTANSD